MNLKTPQATIALGVVGLLLLGALSWFLFIHPAQAKLASAQADLDSAAAATQASETQLRSLRAARDGLDKTQRAAERLAKIFPPTADQPGFFDAVGAAAASAGIPASSVTTLSPTVPLSEADLSKATTPEARAAALTSAPDAVQTISIAISAPFAQAQKMLANLEQMDRGLLVQSAEFSGTGDTATLSVIGRLYVAPPLTPPNLTTTSP